MANEPQVTYFAKSIFNSITFWVNALSLIAMVLSLSEVAVLIPIRFVPVFTAVVAIVNVALRFITVRPVAVIPLGEVKPVTVNRLPSSRGDAPGAMG